MVEKKLAELGLTLPPAPKAAGSYVGYTQIGDLVFVSAQIPLKDGKPSLIGKLGAGLGVEEGYRGAQQCAVNILAHLKQAVGGDWDRVRRVVRLGGFVNCVADFPDAPKVVNGASDVMMKVFGNAGEHARAAVGVASLPANSAVEVEAIFQVRA